MHTAEILTAPSATSLHGPARALAAATHGSDPVALGEQPVRVARQRDQKNVERRSR